MGVKVEFVKRYNDGGTFNLVVKVDGVLCNLEYGYYVDRKLVLHENNGQPMVLAGIVGSSMGAMVADEFWPEFLDSLVTGLSDADRAALAECN